MSWPASCTLRVAGEASETRVPFSSDPTGFTHGCKRAGAYRLAQLAAKYGAEILLDDLLVR